MHDMTVCDMKTHGGDEIYAVLAVGKASEAARGWVNVHRRRWMGKLCVCGEKRAAMFLFQTQPAQSTRARQLEWVSIAEQYGKAEENK